MKHTKDSDLATHESFAPPSSIPGVDYLKRVNEAVWTIDPAELREQNTKKLRDAGVEEDNGLFIIVSADYVFWVDDLGEVITLMAEKFDDMVVAERDLWIRGRASDEFVTEMQNLGWGLHQQVDLAAKVKEEFTQPSKQ